MCVMYYLMTYFDVMYYLMTHFDVMYYLMTYFDVITVLYMAYYNRCENLNVCYHRLM